MSKLHTFMIELSSIAVSKLRAESCTGVQISGSGTVSINFEHATWYQFQTRLSSFQLQSLYMAFAKMVTSNNCQLICWSCAGKLIIVICQVPFHLKFQTWANCKFCKSSGPTHYLSSRVGQLALHVLRFPFCAKWELIFCLPVVILWSEFWVLTSA
jgi:hypothetical protein